MKQYAKNEVVRFFSPFNIKEGDIIYIHSDLFKFGLYENNSYELCLKLSEDVLYAALYSLIGKNGTIIVPAYSNSWSKGEVFSEHESAINTGIFSKYISQLSGSYRSQHGLFSLAGIGKNAKEILSGKNKSSFGKDSPFHKLLLKNALLLSLGTNLNSFKDYVEIFMEVPYRYKKVFYGQINVNNKLSTSHNIHHVRFENQPISLLNFVDSIGEKNLLAYSDDKQHNLIKGIRAKNAFELLSSQLSKDKYSFVEGNIQNKKVLEIISLYSSNESIDKYGIYFEAHNKNNYETWKFSIKNKINFKVLSLKDKYGFIIDIPFTYHFKRIKISSMGKKIIQLSKYKKIINNTLEYNCEDYSFWVKSNEIKLLKNIEAISLNLLIGNFSNIGSIIEVEVGGKSSNGINTILQYLDKNPNFIGTKNREIKDFANFLITCSKSINIQFY